MQYLYSSYEGSGKTKGDKWSGILGMIFLCVLSLDTCVLILFLAIKHNRGFFGPASYHVRAMFGSCSVSFGYLSGRGRFVFDLYNRRKDEDGTKKVRGKLSAKGANYRELGTVCLVLK